MIPAAGQGILAIAMRKGDVRRRSARRRLRRRERARCRATASAASSRALGGGCQAPGRARSPRRSASEIVITGIIVSPDGIDVYKGDHQGAGRERRRDRQAPRRIDLLDQGGDKVVRKARALLGG